MIFAIVGQPEAIEHWGFYLAFFQNPRHRKYLAVSSNYHPQCKKSYLSS
jgi:hypothetical protein